MATTGADGGDALTTARLVLRPVTETDVPDIVRLAGDIRVAEWTTRIPHPLTPEGVADWLAGLNRGVTGAGERAFAILEKAAAALLGAASLTIEEMDRTAEIGYWIAQPFWGKGFATEAVRCLVVLGFRELGLTRIEAPVFEGNIRSARVLEKTGFQARGRRMLAAPARSGPREAVLYRMDPVDFARSILSQGEGRA